MADLTLACGAYNFVLDASSTSIAFNSLNDINYTSTSGKHVFSGGVKFNGMAAGFASFDASGNISSVAGSLFDSAAVTSVSAAWTFGSTLSVTGQLSAAGKIVNSGILSQAPVLSVPTQGPASGWKYVIVNDTTGEFRKMA